MTLEADMEKQTSGLEKCVQYTAVAGELFVFRSPPGEGNWPGAILERAQFSSEFGFGSI